MDFSLSNKLSREEAATEVSVALSTGKKETFSPPFFRQNTILRIKRRIEHENKIEKAKFVGSITKL